ncbi:MAG: hypothetical protein BVN35_06170 [Proteobacteria bacterium ST_bin11]|nr:MAG: hypothetical protein BVN35_06170 [Proteobacteria bacterium ST_bin11]
MPALPKHVMSAFLSKNSKSSVELFSEYETKMEEAKKLEAAAQSAPTSRKVSMSSLAPPVSEFALAQAKANAMANAASRKRTNRGKSSSSSSSTTSSEDNGETKTKRKRSQQKPKSRLDFPKEESNNDSDDSGSAELSEGERLAEETARNLDSSDVDEGDSANEEPTAEDLDFICDDDEESYDESGSDDEEDYDDISSDSDASARVRSKTRNKDLLIELASSSNDDFSGVSKIDVIPQDGVVGQLIYKDDDESESDDDNDSDVSTSLEANDDEEYEELRLKLMKDDEENECDDLESAYISTKNAELDIRDTKRIALIRKNYKLCDSHLEPSVYNMLMGIAQSMLKELPDDVFGDCFVEVLINASTIVENGRRWKAGFPFVNACYLWLNLKLQCVDKFSSIYKDKTSLVEWLSVFKTYKGLDDKPVYEELSDDSQRCFSTGVACRTGISLVDFRSKNAVATLWYDYNNSVIAHWVNDLTRLFFLPGSICEWFTLNGFDKIHKLSYEQMAEVILYVENASRIYTELLYNCDIVHSEKGLISVK